MIRKLSILLLALLSITAQAEVWQARYGVAETFNFKLYAADGTLDVDEADSGTEVSVSCNEGTETTATNDFADEGTFYSIALTATEMQCERIAVVVAATTTEVFFIQTSANASAMTPSYEVNVGTITAAAITAAAIADAAIDEATFATTTGSFAALGWTRQGTAQAATSTTVTLDASAPFGDNTNIGGTLWVRGSTNGNYWQPTLITGYVASTQVATVTTESGFVTPTGTITYKLFGTASSAGGSGLDAAGVRSAIGLASANLDTQLSVIDTNVDDIETDTGTTLPATLATIAGYIDTEVAAILVDTGTTLDGKIDTIDTVADAIKAKTDQLTFGVTNTLNVNAEYMNAVEILGSGTTASPWNGE